MLRLPRKQSGAHLVKGISGLTHISGAFVAVDLYLHGRLDDPIAAAGSPEALELSRQSVHAWITAVEASGTATTDEIAAAAEMSFATFSPQSEEASG